MSEKCELSQVETKGLLWYIGFLFVCFLLFKLLLSLWRGLYTCFIANLIGATVNWKKLGKWAIVTGSTDGIGRSYAKALAAKGFDIVLISRNPEKLENVAQEIEKKYSVKTKIIPVDITDELVIYDKIKKEIEDLEIGVLVNNVGMSYDFAEYLTKVKHAEKLTDDIVKANITSVLRMSLLVLPQMEKREKGVIINISSLSALFPLPLLSVYSASKVFVDFFSIATQEEYKKKGIIIQSVLPGFVSTKMSKMRPSLSTCTPDAYVKWALKTVGVETHTYGYPFHKLQGYATELLVTYCPQDLVLAINHRVTSGIRRSYYRKFGLVDDEKKNAAKHK